MHKFLKNIRKYLNCIVAVLLIGALVAPVGATSVSDLKDLIEEQQGQLDNINDNILDMEDAQSLLEEEISDLNAEILNTMTAIGLLEDDIAAKQVAIEENQILYEEAKATQENQYEAMKVRIQLMYETGNLSYLEMILGAADLSDMLNRADYIEAVYEYDQKMLGQYAEQKEHVADIQTQLEADKAGLESDMASMEEQKTYLDGLLVKKQAESENYDTQIAKAKQEAAAYKKKIQQEQEQIKKLEEEEKRKAAAAAVANGKYNVTKFDTSITDNATGSDLGKKVAKYACQYIGNPYVYGGTSLTKGADCSGFTYRVYSDFGYTLPRTSFQQRSAGKAVSYEDAQPGDLICYDGHVGLYVGGGYIVHASSKKTGIKISKATYRSIVAVRRIIE